MTFSMEMVVFFLLAIVAIAGGILLLNLKKVVHMVVGLLFTFLSVAGIYVLLSAEFLAVVQLLVYAGSIMIVMLFGIMLTNHNETSEPQKGRFRKILLLLGVIGFGAAIYLGIYNLDFHPEEAKLYVNNTEQIGKALYTKYIIPFEVTSVVLLVGLIGAILLSKKDEDEEEKEANKE